MSQREMSGSQYNPSVDVARFLAACALVLFHSAAPVSEVGEPAAAFFAAVTIYFALAAFSRSSSGLGATLRKRAGILLPMFATWCTIYLIAIIGKELLTGGDVMADIVAFLPPHGSLKQFWFLPWSLAACVVVLWGASLLRRPLPNAVAIGGAAGFLVAVCLVLSATDLPLFPRLCLLYAPSAVFGALLWRLRETPRLNLVTGLAFGVLGWALWGAGAEGTSQARFAMPLLGVIFVLRFPIKDAFARKAGQVSGDIYLVHLLVIPTLEIVLRQDSVEMGVMAVLVSTLAALALGQLRAGMALPSRPILRHV